ncbi:MAG TPA: CAP domain-containing protein, partial [Isosphaeraceae bacterium]|nr:CAP domain-containing protein [Isosphaeraceae bacterium]
VKRKGYVFVKVGENIANGQKTIDEVMTSWMNSPGHRANILAKFTEMGAARVEDDEGVIYWCVDFGLPMPRLNPEDAADAVLKKLNLDRVAAKRPKLKAEPALGRAAMKLSAGLAAKDSLKPEGDPFKVIDDQGVRLRELRIMFSANVPTPEEATKSLLGDDAEELNAFEEIGIGYAIAESGTPYWCAIFAKPAPPKRILRP